MSFFTKHRITKPNCPKCKLDQSCKNPNMGVVGHGEKGILIITECPEKVEDDRGVQLIGKANLRLSKELRKCGIDLKEDCWKINAVQCRRTGDKSTPETKHIDACRVSVEEHIKKLKPNKIILLGAVALESFYGNKFKSAVSLRTSVGQVFWDSTFNAYVFPLWSTNHLIHREKDDLLHAEFSRKLRKAIKHEDKPVVKQWNPLHLLVDYNDAMDALEKCLNFSTLIAVDYETTGLDMWKKGHKTVSFAWADNNASYSVPVEHPHWKKKQQRKIKKLVTLIMRKRKIKKVVQGIDYEYPYTVSNLKCKPHSIFYDTRLGSHILDNRTGVHTGLKFQTFRRWGISYNDESAKYIKTSPKTGFNDMLKMPVDALLKYNALDTLYTYELYKEQLTEFQGNQLQALGFLHKGALAFCEMTCNGIAVNVEYYEKQRTKLLREQKELVANVMAMDEVTQYQKRFGAFEYNSPKHLQNMLFKTLGLKPIKKTKTGNSVDEEVLLKIDIPLTRNILKVRKLGKIISTYVDGFIKHTEHGYMHPGFPLHRVVSYRGSSRAPNWQNVPKRDPKAKKITRSGIVPRHPDNVIGEMDFSGAEINTSCFFHCDPTFYKYQTDPKGGDMHRDACAEILKITADEVLLLPQLRQCTKGVWTFSQFYGSYYANCAKQGWDEYPQVVDKNGDPIQVRGMDIGDWMIHTFKTYKNFENHLKKFEDKFWHDWFPVYTKWKKKVVSDYKKMGYVETFLGFRFQGLMDRKQCTNYPVQGTSFHLLMYTAYLTMRELRRRGLKTLIVGQIHDSVILDIPKDEVKAVHEMLLDIVGNLHKEFTWMTIPMEMDFEISDPASEGGSFAHVEKVELKEAA